MGRYKIWMEGYAATSQSAPATFVAEVRAHNFTEACTSHYKDDPYFDSNKLTYWGCKLFSNEKDARKGFG